ncbi:chromate transporter [Salinicoccus roseus]|jgi:chromate transporter|uniref:Transporter n=1 Tax=Salinicoccus roseus TaxID=45670 RepID=A0A265E7T9_9STAP|nr:chromate transporter [Salinicoccus roseus]OZT77643.1 transporter [Salinicoccus roseus]RPE52753.1 chromate transporter [Salinicoccus roseus]GGA73711.1 putative transporter YwrA [Salinicoccus roseus]
MIYLQIFLAFFIPGVLGYGGGPASIPLVEQEVVQNYEWMDSQEFAEVLALGNALPGPIATKMAGFIGFEVGGVLGSVVAVTATVMPSLMLMVFLAGLLYRLKGTKKFETLTTLIRPVIAILLGIIAYDFFSNAFADSGSLHTIILIVASFLMLTKFNVHPALVIIFGLVYGAFLL